MDCPCLLPRPSELIQLGFCNFYSEMVFTTFHLLRKICYSVPTKNPDRYWQRRKILRMSAHFRRRAQNCFTLARRAVHRALRYATYARKRKGKDNKELFVARLSAACEEHGFSYGLFREGLIRSNVLLNSKTLCNLAIWEPRTFKCLTDFAWKKAAEEGLNGINDLGEPPSGVILKPMIIK